MQGPDASDDFERRRRAARFLSRVHLLSLALLVLSVMPGMPCLLLASSVAFQDQLEWFEPRLASGCLAVVFVAGLVGSVVASVRQKKLFGPASPGQREPAAKEPAGGHDVFGIHSAVAVGALLICLAAILAAFTGSTRYPTLDFWPRLIWSCAVMIPLAAAITAVWRRLRRSAPGWFHVVVAALALLGVPIVAYAIVVWCNGALDSSDVKSHEATLLQKHTRSEGKGAPSLWMELSSWRDARQSERIRVTARMFESYNRGDTVTVSTRTGALRMEYWTWIASSPLAATPSRRSAP